MKTGDRQSFSMSAFVSGRLALKPPQPSKPQSHSSLSGLEGSLVGVDGDSGGEDELGEDVDSSSEDELPTAVDAEGEKSYCAATFLKWSWM